MYCVGVRAPTIVNAKRSAVALTYALELAKQQLRKTGGAQVNAPWSLKSEKEKDVDDEKLAS